MNQSIPYFQPHQANQMNQMNPTNESNTLPPKVFGNHDICNFGKYKGSSWYDIANGRNFGYFNWMLNNMSINSNCINHINCIQKEADKFLKNSNLLWEKIEKPLENGHISRKYTYCENCPGGESIPIFGPEVELQYCSSCNFLNPLSKYSDDSQHKICNYCYKKSTESNKNNNNYSKSYSNLPNHSNYSKSKYSNPYYQ